MANLAEQWRQVQREFYWGEPHEAYFPYDVVPTNGFAVSADGTEVNPYTGECNPFTGDVTECLGSRCAQDLDAFERLGLRRRREHERPNVGPVEAIFGGVYGGRVD